MKRNVLNVLLICFSGCASNPHFITYEKAKEQAIKDAPFIPPKAEKRLHLNCSDKPVVLKKSDSIPYTGLLFTTDRAACIRAIAAERDRLRKDLEAEILRSKTNRIIREAAYKKLISLGKRSWWDKHGAGILFASGAVVGMAIVTGVMYILTGGKSINNSTTR